MAKDVKRHTSRAFLNKLGHHTVAAVHIALTHSKYRQGGTVQISDCGDTIYLDMNAYNAEQYSNALVKFDKLIAQLTKARDWYAKNTPTFEKEAAEDSCD